MKTRPILFNGDMVRALLDGRKTQTRRLVKPQPAPDQSWRGWVIESSNQRHEGCASWVVDGIGPLSTINATYARPPCEAGDLMWVRETFISGFEFDDNDIPTEKERTWYRANGDLDCWYDGGSDFPKENIPWKPSIHMPRRASRLTLRITNVRVERLQEISASDSKAEGAPDTSRPGVQISLKRGFQNLWMRINGGDSWDANPWVWVIEFEVIHANVDTILKQEAA
jgi:hypothetical protein